MSLQWTSDAACPGPAMARSRSDDDQISAMTGPSFRVGTVTASPFFEATLLMLLPHTQQPLRPSYLVVHLILS